MIIDTKGARDIFVPGDIESSHVRNMSLDELFDMGMGHIADARAGKVVNPVVKIQWGKALVIRSFGMLGVPPKDVVF